MGVFDFIRDAGAKVGIGKSTEEREKEKADAAVQRGLEAQRKMAAEAQARRKKQQETEDDAAKKRRAMSSQTRRSDSLSREGSAARVVGMIAW